jgi:hypothetical protein
LHTCYYVGCYYYGQLPLTPHTQAYSSTPCQHPVEPATPVQGLLAHSSTSVLQSVPVMPAGQAPAGDRCTHTAKESCQSSAPPADLPCSPRRTNHAWSEGSVSCAISGPPTKAPLAAWNPAGPSGSIQKNPKSSVEPGLTPSVRAAPFCQPVMAVPTVLIEGEGADGLQVGPWQYVSGPSVRNDVSATGCVVASSAFW